MQGCTRALTAPLPMMMLSIVWLTDADMSGSNGWTDQLAWIDDLNSATHLEDRNCHGTCTGLLRIYLVNRGWS